MICRKCQLWTEPAKMKGVLCWACEPAEPSAGSKRDFPVYAARLMSYKAKVGNGEGAAINVYKILTPGADPAVTFSVPADKPEDVHLAHPQFPWLFASSYEPTGEPDTYRVTFTPRDYAVMPKGA